MGLLERRSFDLGRTDELARQETWLHRLDSRAKILVTLFYVITVVSHDRYALAALMPLFAYPIWLMAAGRIPAGYLLVKLALVAPFALLVGAANPFLDTQTQLVIGTLPISGGWLSFVSIFLRFVLSVSAALLLVATTGFDRVCAGMSRLGVPQVLVVQFLFLYRYLFVLTDQTRRMVRARALRSVGHRGQGLASYGPLVGHLALRTMGRAQRIYQAMACRGFDGTMPCPAAGRWRRQEACFVAGWALFFVLARSYNLPGLLGTLIYRGLP